MDDGIPSQEMITGLTKYITDPNIRPLTDKVVVKAPTAVNYSISLTIISILQIQDPWKQSRARSPRQWMTS